MKSFLRIFLLPLLALALSVAACDGDSAGKDAGSDAGTDGGDAGQYPDPGFVYEAQGQTETVSDTTFQMETPRLFRTVDELPDLDVRRVNDFGEKILAGTASGLMQMNYDGERFERLTMPGGDEAIVDMAEGLTANGQAVLLTPTRVVLLDMEGTDHQEITLDGTATAVTTDGDEVLVGHAAGVWRLDNGSLVPVDGAPATSIRDLLLAQTGDLYLATGEGVWARREGTWNQRRAADELLLDDDVQSLAKGPGDGLMLAGTATGFTVWMDETAVHVPAGLGGLPRGSVHAVAASANRYLLGHDLGASLFALGDDPPEELNFYHSLRWLPSDEVRDVDFPVDDRMFIATSAGITRITYTPRTLAERADIFEEMNDLFWRLDFVSCGGRRTDPWNLDEPLVHRDHDNDGLWSQMQIAAWSYAAAATGDEAYCELARRSMGGMMDQIDIPAVSFQAAGYERGFVARSFVRDDEGEIFDNKATRDNWHLVENWEDGHDYYWKDDTSSDETTGHFFGYPLFYDFCATEAEKAVLADHAGALARYIVEGGFRLMDLDGERTLHGHWDPETLAIALDGVGPCSQNYPLEECMSAAYGGGWLNAIEILGHMLAAYHMTGDPYFYDAYTTLIEEHRYAELVDFHEEIYTVTSPAIANHSDHELVMLGYHTLIRYEPDDERRQRWIDSLLAMYEYEKPERNPCWSAFVAGFVPEGYELADAIETLRVWPEDWREWRVDNSIRMDVEQDVDDRHGHEQIKTVLPYDEIRTMKWNGNPYVLADGGDGREQQAPWPWLLPYWMYRYHGVIE